MTGVNFSPNAMPDYNALAANAKAAQPQDSDAFADSVTHRLAKGKTLGIGSLNEGAMRYGMTAAYAPNSTAQNPVIQVNVQRGGGRTETFHINIKQINTFNASAIEMFALCNYADDIGMGTGSTFGSWNTLKYYSENAAHNNYGRNIADTTLDAFVNERQNWNVLVAQMMRDYANAGLSGQAQDGASLLAMFEQAQETDEKDEMDWRTMSADAWNKLLDNIDEYIEAYKERLKALKEAQSKAADEAARRAPAAYKAMAAQAAAANVALLAAMSAVSSSMSAAADGISEAEAAEKAALSPEKETEEAPDEEASVTGANRALTKWQEYVLTGSVTAGMSGSAADGAASGSAGDGIEVASTRPTDDSIDKPKDTWFVTAFTEQGIICTKCVKGGENTVIWQMEYKNAGDYEKVTNFLKRFDKDENLTFASKEQFWRDFLDDKIDADDFYNFYESGAKDGIYSYGIQLGDTTRIDTAQVKYSEYVSAPIAHAIAFTSINVQTGESVSVYKADTYSDIHPVYVVAGRDANGNSYKKEIDVREVDPTNCTYIELAALNAHLYGDDMTPSQYLDLVIMQHASGVGIDEKADYLAIAKEKLLQVQQNGNKTGERNYKEWLEMIDTFFGNAVPEAAADTVYEKKHFWEAALDHAGPNAPEAVRKAWQETAEEMGMDGYGTSANGMMSHISRFMVWQLEGRMRGEVNYTDILGDSVSSAIAAAQKAIYEIEHPLEPEGSRTAQAMQSIAKEKEFFKRFAARLSVL